MSAVISSFQNKRVLVQGLGRFGGGVGVTRWLVSQGAIVTVTDTASETELAGSLAQLADLPRQQLAFKLGGHDEEDFRRSELLVTNPAVDKAKSPHVHAAKDAGVPITSELNLFLERNRGRVIGITGSVGKSTTTTLIHLAVQAAVGEGGPKVFLGGNIGKSLLSDLPNITGRDLVILELSSFMLEETPAISWSPNIAVITNLYPNHLDRHTWEEYAAAKQNILRFQSRARGDVAIFNADHELVAGWRQLAQAKVDTYSTRDKSRWIELSIPGEHNQSNAQAALAVLNNLPPELKLNRPAALQTMAEFKGLSHRLELVHVAEILAGRKLKFYNDSKGTSPDASITAIRAFDPQSAIFIVGGFDKEISLAGFAAILREYAAGVLGIGDTGQEIVDLVAAGGGARPRAAYVGALAAAVGEARRWAVEDGRVGSVVLSPGCASWDQYNNYEERGAQFATLSRI